MRPALDPIGFVVSHDTDHPAALRALHRANVMQTFGALGTVEPLATYAERTHERNAATWAEIDPPFMGLDPRNPADANR